jgi:dTDP-4-amino-4,6-dideoxygalactose transaminase
MIRFQRPALPPTSAIDPYLDLSRQERWFSNGGPCWRLLRDRLSERAGAYCVPVASGTLGLMAALAAVLEVPTATPRRGALIPSFTFLATAQAAIWSGLEPRLADIDPGHWHLDPELLERALEQDGEIAAVLAVSAFGTPPPPATRERWERACRRAGIPLVVDSAAGFGARAADGVPIGAQGDVEVVSFHATKPFAIGEGGAVFTRDASLRDRLELAVNFGFRPDRTVGLTHGLNAKMSELHAATALAVLDRLDTIVADRRASVAEIRAGAGASIAWQEDAELSTWQFVPVALPDRVRRERLAASTRDQIETRVYYDPLHDLVPDYAVVSSLERTDDLFARILCLPMANDLDEVERETITAALAAA